ncbi:MAG: DUF932 domain-containing protein [Bacteroidetes bacterium]|nr:DUF932 domain-containing protein [Bacteroidota bacterium]
MNTEFELLQVQPPMVTTSYQPVSHGILIDTVGEKLYKHGLNISKKRFSANHSGSQMFAVYDLEHSRHETTLNIGFRNSYDKSLPVGMVAGGTVIVCSNLMFKGEIKMVRKHTKHVFQDMETIVEEVISKAVFQYEQLEEDKETMKLRLLSKREMAELAGRMFIEDGLVNPTQMNILAREIQHSENFGGNSVWDLYNHTTEALKRSHPSQAMQDHIKVHDFMMQLV